MCGRYYIEIDDREMKDIISQVEKNVAMKTGEVFPTDHAPVIPPTGVTRVMRWGFPRFDGKGQVINARSETAGDKPMFRACMRQSRCLIPASFYFEWEHAGTQKTKYALALPERRVLMMAGLYRTEADGQESFVILTRPAWNGISFIHDRMPVILPVSAQDEWLNGHDPKAAIGRAQDEVEYRIG